MKKEECKKCSANKNHDWGLWKCEICGKEVKDKGKGFRVFIEYPLVFKGVMVGEKKQQIRICAKNA